MILLTEINRLDDIPHCKNFITPIGTFKTLENDTPISTSLYDENHFYFLLQSSVRASYHFNFNVLFKSFFMKTKNFESCSIYPGEFIPEANEAFAIKQLKGMKDSEATVCWFWSLASE